VEGKFMPQGSEDIQVRRCWALMIAAYRQT